MKKLRYHLVLFLAVIVILAVTTSCSLHDETKNYFDCSEGMVCKKIHDRWGMYDTNGNFLFEVDDKPTTHFYNGIAIVGNSVINNKGEAIITPESHLYDSIRLDYTSLNGEFYGYIFVVRVTKSFYENRTELGIIDSDGKWQIELSENLNESFYKYYGKGIYLLRKGNSYGASYYNAITNKFLDINTDDLSFYLNSCEGLLFRNSYSYPQGFYDKNHNLVIDLSGFSLLNKPKFENGYSALIAKGADQKDYLIIIDKQGNMTHSEPIRLDSISRKLGLYVMQTLDFIVLEDDTNHTTYISQDEIHYILNINGELVTQFVGVLHPFQNGIAIVETRKEKYFINTDWERIRLP